MQATKTLAFLAFTTLAAAQQAASDRPSNRPLDRFGAAAEELQRDVLDQTQELAALREELRDRQLPLSRQLGELERELSGLRAEFQDATKALDSSALELSNLRIEIKERRDEIAYLSNLLGDYIRNFEAGLHIAELAHYQESIEGARAAADAGELSESDIFTAQAAVLERSLGRLEDALGGVRFEGSAIDDTTGLVRTGTFVLVGPAGLFLSTDGETVGLVDQQLGELMPTVFAFADPADAAAARELIANGAGSYPLDPTLGNAQKIEATEETFVEHVQKGGAVMIPIFVMAGLALLVALTKWISLMLVRKPSKKRIDELLVAVAEHDEDLARARVAAIKGPVGRMLAAGVEHLREPRDLVEEVMYEMVLTTRLKLERGLAFIAICAASAPLLGLLGTVTGIINTFKLITVFGSGDVKSLSGGISEALITTKFGLIVAIPSLLLHAFLSRRARGFISRMETAAVAFANQLSKTPYERTNGPGSGAVVTPVAPTHEAREAVRTQVSEVLRELLGPNAKELLRERPEKVTQAG